MEEDVYSILGVERTASKEEIRRAFKKLALRWHPDKHPPEMRLQAEEAFKKIARAYEELSGAQKSQYFQEDIFTDFFSKFFKKYNKWSEDWASPANKEARKQATATLWEEEEAKLKDPQNLRKQFPLPIYHVEDTARWSDYANSKNFKPSNVLSAFNFNETLNTKISFWRGAIYSLAVDAICNSTDSSLSGTGCLDSYIHNYAGCRLREETLLLDECPIGQVAITRGYNLPAKYVIHCAGPNNGSAHYLASCYHAALDVAIEHGIKTIAFPCLATGLNSFPLEASSQVALQTVRRWMEKDNNSEKIDRIVFVFWRHTEEVLYSKWAPSVFPLPFTLTYHDSLNENTVQTLKYWTQAHQTLDPWIDDDQDDPSEEDIEENED